MISQTLNLSATNGLHTRISAQLVNLAKSFSSEMTVQFKDKKANMKSLFELQGLHLMKNAEITIVVQGNDEKKAFATVLQFLEHLE